MQSHLNLGYVSLPIHDSLDLNYCDHFHALPSLYAKAARKLLFKYSQDNLTTDISKYTDCQFSPDIKETKSKDTSCK